MSKQSKTEKDKERYIPSTIKSWRWLVSNPPLTKSPKVYSPAEWLQLDESEKQSNTEARKNYLHRGLIIETEQRKSLEWFVDDVMEFNSYITGTAPRMVAASGPAFLGKSTALLDVGIKFEQEARKSYQPSDATDFVPVVYVSLLGGKTSKSLMGAFYSFFGKKYTTRMTSDLMREHVVETMERFDTKLVIIDDIHSLQSGGIDQRHAASTLKSFIEQTSATFLFAGLDIYKSALTQAEGLGEQILERLDVVEFQPNHYQTKEEQRLWHSWVASFESRLPLMKHQPKTLANKEVAAELHAQAKGQIGKLRELIVRASSRAIKDGSEYINLEKVLVGASSRRVNSTNAIDTPKGIGRVAS